jgi:hypothetical protein
MSVNEKVPVQALFDFPGLSDFEIVLDPENDGPKPRKRLTLRCNKCRKKIRVAMRWVGARGFCGHCKRKILIPLDTPEQPPESLNAFERAAALAQVDPEACEEALLIAAQTQHPDALYALGHLHMLGASGWRALFDRKSMRRDYPKAREWFVQAADQGHGRAQLALGFMHYRGMGGQKDRARAFMWFTLAAQRGEKTGEQHARSMWHHMEPHEHEAAKLMIERWYEARES